MKILTSQSQPAHSTHHEQLSSLVNPPPVVSSLPASDLYQTVRRRWPAYVGYTSEFQAQTSWAS